jgi:hypothetical protein
MAGLLLGLTVLMSPLTAVASPLDSVDFWLDAHRWEHRLLFVFAPSASDADLREQRAAFREQAAGFRDRDLLLLTLTGDGKKGAFQAEPGGDARPLTTAAVRRLYDRFRVDASEFRIVLVGKDGTEKRRDPAPVTARSLFDTIDAMPMRQREMREGDGP